MECRIDKTNRAFRKIKSAVCYFNGWKMLTLGSDLVAAPKMTYSK